MKISQHDLIPAIKDLLDEAKTVTFKVKGTSMRPFYKSDITNVTLIKKYPRKLDVVLAKYNDHYVLHRVLKINQEGIILRGDSTFTKEFIKSSDVIGVVIKYQTTKEVTSTSKSYKLKVYLWVYNPFRRLLLRFVK